MARRAPTSLPLSSLLALSGFSLACLTCAPASLAGEVYGSVGLPGVVVGYAHTVNQHLGLRVDAGTTGSFTRSRTESGIPYSVKFKYNRIGLFGDYFPFGGRFRFTTGLTINDTALTLKTRFDGNTSVTFNQTTITPTANDRFDATVKIPRITPYFGLGWGHQAREAGLGFIADVGVSIGRAKLSVHQNLLENYPGILTQNDIDVKTGELRDNVAKVRVLPQASIGISYRY
jgi:hypothetical protein